jgi:hypothetical protein
MKEERKFTQKEDVDYLKKTSGPQGWEMADECG